MKARSGDHGKPPPGLRAHGARRAAFPPTEWAPRWALLRLPCQAPQTRFCAVGAAPAEPEIWKNLTPSRLKLRKTLLKVNTALPPSSSRNAARAALRSRLSKAPAAAEQGRERLRPAFWPRQGRGPPAAPAPGLAVALRDPGCRQTPHAAPDLGKRGGRRAPAEPSLRSGGAEPRSGSAGPSRFRCRRQAVKEALCLREERRLCARPERGRSAAPPCAWAGWDAAPTGPAPPTRFLGPRRGRKAPRSPGKRCTCNHLCRCVPPPTPHPRRCRPEQNWKGF